MSLDAPIKILITGKIHDVGINLLKNPPTELKCPRPIEIINIPDASREEILKRISDVNVLISRSETDVDEKLLRLGKNLSLVARAAVGYGNIDCDLATELGLRSELQPIRAECLERPSRVPLRHEPFGNNLQSG